MQVDFFGWLGHTLGLIIHYIVEFFSGLFNMLSNAGGDFVGGMSRALGMDTSIISIITLIVGLLFLYSAVRAFMRASIIIGVIWLMLGLSLLLLLPVRMSPRDTVHLKIPHVTPKSYYIDHLNASSLVCE